MTRSLVRHAAARIWGAVVALSLLASATSAQALRATAAPAAPSVRHVPVRAVGVVGLTVSDMDRSLAFYTSVLGFEQVSDAEVVGADVERLSGVFGVRMRVVRLRLGDEALELTEYLAPRGRPAPVDARSNDRWFQHVAIITRDMDSAFARLRAHRVQFASPAPQTLPAWNPNASGIRAFYFRDPDGHPLEVLQFPDGKGAAKWHVKGKALFLGIDHTAIVVELTDSSLALYRDVLGLRVAGRSENYGIEQEHLNNVEGAHLRITSLRAAAGPGIEFLEYQEPRDGRPFPSDERANDLVHWQTTLYTTNADSAAATLVAAGYRLVSRGVASVAESSLGVHKAVLVRDRDGHVLELAEP